VVRTASGRHARRFPGWRVTVVLSRRLSRAERFPPLTKRSKRPRRRGRGSGRGLFGRDCHESVWIHRTTCARCAQPRPYVGLGRRAVSGR
jgi:hypothetical protein